MNTEETKDEAWVPAACTLPAVARGTRRAEFDELFRTALRGQERLAPTRLRWRLDPAAEAAARELTERESWCCAFFTFTFSRDGDGLLLDVEVPDAYANVLVALADQAAASGRDRP